MKLMLDHTQVRNLHALLGDAACRRELNSRNLQQAFQDRLTLSVEEKSDIGLERR